LVRTALNEPAPCQERFPLSPVGFPSDDVRNNTSRKKNPEEKKGDAGAKTHDESNPRWRPDLSGA
jgi:hypothetical protein